jgi:hypothetical protein
LLGSKGGFRLRAARRAGPGAHLCNAGTTPLRIALLYRDGVAARHATPRAAERVAALAEGLRKRGLGRGDRVVVLVPMSPALYVTLLAVVSLGAVAVFVEPGAGVAEVARTVRLTRPAALVGIAKAHALRFLRRDVAAVRLAVLVGSRAAARALGAVALADLEAEGAGAALPDLQAAPDAPALITFSSGSTGARAPPAPGPVNRRHRALVARPDGVVEAHMSAFAIACVVRRWPPQIVVSSARLRRRRRRDGDEVARAIAIMGHGGVGIAGAQRPLGKRAAHHLRRRARAHRPRRGPRRSSAGRLRLHRSRTDRHHRSAGARR